MIVSPAVLPQMNQKSLVLGSSIRRIRQVGQIQITTVQKMNEHPSIGKVPIVILIPVGDSHRVIKESHSFHSVIC